MVFASLALAVLHHVEAACWAIVYVGLDVLPDWDTAVYFSIVTMTSVGYGDVTLSGDWRLLAALQAMNGMLLFGLSTAFLFAILQHCCVLLFKDSVDRHGIECHAAVSTTGMIKCHKIRKRKNI